MAEDEKKDEYSYLVPYFNTKENQIRFECWYIVFTFLIVVGLVVAIHFKYKIAIDHDTKVLVYSFLGGFLGGWTLVVKWFYRVTARGKENQYKQVWEKHKFYWRVFTPFLSAIIAFVLFLLISTDTLPLAIKDKDSSKIAFGLSFLFGYFSDIVMSKLSKWMESSMNSEGSG